MIMPKAEFKDPRRAKGFKAHMFPLCDGEPAPPMSAKDPVCRKMIEFACHYYRLNFLYDRLKRIRLGESSEDAAAVLTEVDHATQARDVLEDTYAPEGFYAEPIVDGLMTVDLVFSHALKRWAPQGPAPASSFSLFVPMPEPGEDIEAHFRRHLAGLFALSSEHATTPSGRKPISTVKMNPKSENKIKRKSHPK